MPGGAKRCGFSGFLIFGIFGIFRIFEIFGNFGNFGEFPIFAKDRLFCSSACFSPGGHRLHRVPFVPLRRGYHWSPGHWGKSSRGAEASKIKGMRLFGGDLGFPKISEFSISLQIP